MRTLAAALLVSAAITASAAPAPPVFEKPGLLVSAGQSSDLAVVKVLLNTKLKLGLDVKPVAQPADLAGQKALVVVVGASSKGLGAAGLDLGKEADRTKALLAAAREKKVPVLALHTGGQARRGKTTDDLIQLVVSQSDYAVVVAGGNADKFFQSAGKARAVPVVEVDSLAAAGDAVKAVFK